MSDTIDTHDTKHAPLGHASGRRPGHGPGRPTSSSERRVIDLDSVTDTAPAGAKQPAVALPPVRDTSYYLG